METDYYSGHTQIQLKPPHFLIVTDRYITWCKQVTQLSPSPPQYIPACTKCVYVCYCRRMLLIERKILTEGWKSFQDIEFRMFESPVEIKDVTVLIHYSKKYKVRCPGYGANALDIVYLSYSGQEVS